MPEDLPEAVLRFDPAETVTMPGSVQRCVVVVDGEDVGELQIAEMSYEQKASAYGLWSISLFADSTDPLSRTLKVSR